ncbi:MAG TPA: Gfo/Idh/MocA family oxidoreductase [Acidimicrobiales bacterium]|nr:Gfo/Idh/MocA family oxidoreductase [Acidimicrobiales bacterium]
MINVAVVGAGAISSSHIEAYLAFPDRAQIVAVVDIYPEKAERQVAKYALNATVFDTHRRLLDGPPIDLVSVATPPGTHAEIEVDLLRAGFHVMGEKPMAASLEECDAVLAAAEAGGGVLSIVAQNRFRTPMMRLKRALDSGLAGRVLHVQVDSHWWRGHSYYDLWWRGTWASEGGGPTLNHAVHHIDALQWMMGSPVEVIALMGNVAHDNAEVEDLSVAVLRFESGALGQLTSSVVHHGEEQQLAFQAERAKIAWPWAVYASVPRANGFPERNTALEDQLTEAYEGLAPLPHEGHAGQVNDVLTAIETGRPPLVDGREGRKTIEIITAIYQSCITSAPARLPIGPGDSFYTREGLLERAPHFHEKSASVAEFSDNEITTAGRAPDRRPAAGL